MLDKDSLDGLKEGRRTFFEFLHAQAPLSHLDVIFTLFAVVDYVQANIWTAGLNKMALGHLGF